MLDLPYLVECAQHLVLVGNVFIMYCAGTPCMLHDQCMTIASWCILYRTSSCQLFRVCSESQETQCSCANGLPQVGTNCDVATTESPREMSSTSRDVSVSDLLTGKKYEKMRSSPWTRELFHLLHGKAFS